MSSRRTKEHTHGTSGLRTGCKMATALGSVTDTLEMTKEQSQDNFERKTTWATVAVDFEKDTATKIPTARVQAMVKGREVYRHTGQVLRQTWKQIAMLGEVEDMTELSTEQASDLMFVGLATAEGFAKVVKLRCETKVAEFVTKWLQEKAAGRRRDFEPHMPREGPCPMERELKECRDKIKKKNTPKTENW